LGYMPRPSHLPQLEHTNYTWERRSPLCSFLQPPVTSSLFSTNILLSTLFSNTLSLYSSLNAKDQVSHAYRTKGRIIALCVLIFKLFVSRRNDRRFCTEW
jgi:hypothetical protein